MPYLPRLEGNLCARELTINGVAIPISMASRGSCTWKAIAKRRAVFLHRERALLAAAVLPGTGFDRLFRLQHERSPEGYAVESGGQVVGHLSHYDPSF